MASGKATKRKRAAQQAPPPPPVRRGGQGRADRRLWIAAATAAALAIAVVIGILSTRGGDEDLTAGSTLPEGAEATALFKGIPQQVDTLGQADAPVTLVEYVDMQCPFCRDFEVDAFPTIVEKYVRPGTVKVELRGLTFIGPDSERGLRSVLAAGQQNHAFEQMQLLFSNQGAENSGWLSQDLVEAAARSIPGVDPGQLVDDMDSGAVSDLLEEHAADAAGRGIDSTPTILVGRTGGELTEVELTSPSDLESIEQAIAAAQNE
jgi:protein-disulfide isomerase